MREVWIPSPHYSTSRSGYNKVVLHTTEGAMKIRDLGAWFQNPSAGCSSHHGADNYERGVFGAYVYENHKAWTQGNANPYCLSLELCAYASWSRTTWLNDKATLIDNAAEWVRYCVDKYNVPWTVLSDYQAQDPNVRGICEHVNFGSWGSGHHDCGSGFPMDVVIDKAKKWGGGDSATTGGVLVSSAVAFDPRNGNQIIAYIAPNGNVCVNGGVVDPDSNAKSGLGLAISETGRKIVTFTNQSGKLCTYTQDANSNDWGWTNKNWNAKLSSISRKGKQMPDKGFDSSAPEAPRNGQNVAVLGFTDNENQGVSVVLVPCPQCSASVEDVQLPNHESWHAAQAGAEPKGKI